jgi:succinate-semialdehyde dehydrogenase
MLARMAWTRPASASTGTNSQEQGKARWNNLKDKKSRGIIGEDAEANMVFVAKPMGVVGQLVTNPIVTPMCNAMFARRPGTR